MEGKEFTINGNKYVFLLTAGNTKNGFYHDCELHINGKFWTKARKHYLNRTWEAYRFQSAMLGAIGEAVRIECEAIQLQLMEEEGWQRLTADRRATLECVINDNASVQELRAVYNAVLTGNGLKSI